MRVPECSIQRRHYLQEQSNVPVVVEETSIVLYLIAFIFVLALFFI